MLPLNINKSSDNLDNINKSSYFRDSLETLELEFSNYQYIKFEELLEKWIDLDSISTILLVNFLQKFILNWYTKEVDIFTKHMYELNTKSNLNKCNNILYNQIIALQNTIQILSKKENLLKIIIEKKKSKIKVILEKIELYYKRKEELVIELKKIKGLIINHNNNYWIFLYKIQDFIDKINFCKTKILSLELELSKTDLEINNLNIKFNALKNFNEKSRILLWILDLLKSKK